MHLLKITAVANWQRHPKAPSALSFCLCFNERLPQNSFKTSFFNPNRTYEDWLPVFTQIHPRFWDFDENRIINPVRSRFTFLLWGPGNLNFFLVLMVKEPLCWHIKALNLSIPHGYAKRIVKLDSHKALQVALGRKQWKFIGVSS